MRSTIEMAREAGCDEIHAAKILTGVHLNPHALERLVELARADERDASINAVLQVIKELRPALVLAAFADKDKAWAIDKIKENIEKLKETK
jgi:hypothetical protein